MIQKIKDWWGLHGEIRGAKKDYDSAAAAERRREAERKKKEQKENEGVKLYTLTYDRTNNEYVLDLNTKARRKDVPHDAVHVTGKKRTYLTTDLWDELVWPGTGQSAIHMYLWLINNSITAEILTQKKAGSDLDWKKIIIAGVVIIAVIIIAPSFIHR